MIAILIATNIPLLIGLIFTLYHLKKQIDLNTEIINDQVDEIVKEDELHSTYLSIEYYTTLLDKLEEEERYEDAKIVNDHIASMLIPPPPNVTVTVSETKRIDVTLK
jgi:hypothetical protein